MSQEGRLDLDDAGVVVEFGPSATVVDLEDPDRSKTLARSLLGHAVGRGHWLPLAIASVLVLVAGTLSASAPSTPGARPATQLPQIPTAAVDAPMPPEHLIRRGRIADQDYSRVSAIRDPSNGAIVMAYTPNSAMIPS